MATWLTRTPGRNRHHDHPHRPHRRTTPAPEHTPQHTRGRRAGDRGFTLPELLFVMVALVIIGGIIATVTINSLRDQSNSTDQVMRQAELTDALTEIARDVAVARPILYTTTGYTSWNTAGQGPVANGPSGNDLWVQSVRDDRCVRIHYWLDTSDTANRRVMSRTLTYPSGAACPDLNAPGSPATNTERTVVSRVANNPSTEPIFTFFTKNNDVLATPIGEASVSKIARVGVNIRAQALGRSTPLVLATSITPRNPAQPTLENLPPPACPTVFTASAGLMHPTITWSASDGALTYALYRRLPAGIRTAPGATTTYPTDWTLIATVDHVDGIPTYSYTDNSHAARNASGEGTVQYRLVASNQGGDSPNCGPVTWTPLPLLAAPQITMTVGPESVTRFIEPGLTQSTINLSWPAVPGADSYEVRREPIANTTGGTFSTVTGAMTATTVSATSGTVTFSEPRPFNTAWRYWVVAVDSRDDRPESGRLRGLTHPLRPTGLTGQATTYGVNDLSWTPLTNVSSSSYWRINNAASPGVEQPFANYLLSGTHAASVSSVNLPSVALNSVFRYRLSSANVGPRGGTTGPGTQPWSTGVVTSEPMGVTYRSVISDPMEIRQFPSDPIGSAVGTQTNAAGTLLNGTVDGTNRVEWSQVPGAHNYRVRTYEVAQAAEPGSYNAVLSSTVQRGTNLTFTQTGLPRGRAIPYSVTAYNRCTNPNFPTSGDGCPSPNHNTDPDAFDPTWTAYQRPMNITVTGGAPAAVTGTACSTTGTPVLTGTDSTTSGIAACGTRRYRVDWVGTADSGQPADRKFCDWQNNPGGCEVRYAVDNTETDTAVATSTTARNAEFVANDWGSMETRQVVLCNNGGCSPRVSRTIKTYPSTFRGDGAGTNAMGHRFNFYENGPTATCISACRIEGDYEANLRWTDATGAADYEYRWQSTGGFGTSNPQGTFTTRSRSDTPVTQVVPGTIYTYDVRARTANLAGTVLRREISPTWYSRAHHVSLLQDASMCSTQGYDHDGSAATPNQPVNDHGWKYGWAVRPTGVFNDRTVEGSTTLLTWWVGRVPAPTSTTSQNDAFIEGIADPSWGTTNNPTTWAAAGTWTNNTSYSQSYTFNQSATIQRGISGDGRLTRLIWNNRRNVAWVAARNTWEPANVGHGLGASWRFSANGNNLEKLYNEANPKSNYTNQQTCDATTRGNVNNRMSSDYTAWYAGADGRVATRRATPSDSAAAPVLTIRMLQAN